MIRSQIGTSFGDIVAEPQCAKLLSFHRQCVGEQVHVQRHREAFQTALTRNQEMNCHKKQNTNTDRHQTSNALPALKRADVDLDTTAHSGKN